MKNDAINTKEVDYFSSETHFVRNFSIGMILGYVIMLIIGVLVDDIKLAIIIGPALGTGLGFGIHGVLNRNKEVRNYSKLKSMIKYIIAFLLFGLLLFGVILTYLIN